MTHRDHDLASHAPHDDRPARGVPADRLDGAWLGAWLGAARGFGHDDDPEDLGESDEEEDDAEVDEDTEDEGEAEAEDEEEFSRGDGVADGHAEVWCPYCGEPSEVALDPGGGTHQDYVEDCQVCCQPWRVTVVYHADGTADVRADCADGR